MRENIWKNIKLGFKTNKLAVAGAAAIILLALISIFAFLYPVDPNAISATERLNAPSMAHLFGTDDMGRDYLARCIYGGRASLLVGFLSMVLSTALGVIIGSISGFVGGTVDAVLMRLVDALMSLPTFLIMIVMNAFLKPGLQNIVLIIGFLTWMNIARIVRGETISLNEREYVIYAKISGQKKFSTIVHHILPNIMPTIIVAATMNIANAILMESALSFFGLGIQPPTALVGKKYTNARKDLLKKVSGIAGVANIPEIQAQTELIDQILHTDYVENAGIDEFENIRKNLRDLMKYIPDKSRNKYMTNFTDEILSTEWKEAELENNDLENYKVRVEYYVRQHQDNYVISKLKKNQPLTEKDVDELEKILWRELGTKEDYEAEFGRKPLGEFVREMVGLDMNAAKEAFSKYLEDVNLDSRQIYFVNQIIEYIVHNGMMKDLSVLLESPFTDRGSISEIFTDMGVWLGIKKVIDTINANAAA